MLEYELMAGAMDMLRNDLIEAGVIDASVAPMFMTEAILGAIQKAALSQQAEVEGWKETVEALTEAREMLYQVSSSALLAGEKCKKEDAGILYSLVCRANVLLLSVLDDISATPTLPQSEDARHTFIAPGDLHPDSVELIAAFATAMAAKLRKAQIKYGYSNGWKDPNWMDECRQKLVEHLAKGDPRDVANYCAFLWHHGESTAASGLLSEKVEPYAWSYFEGAGTGREYISRAKPEWQNPHDLADAEVIIEPLFKMPPTAQQARADGFAEGVKTMWDEVKQLCSDLSSRNQSVYYGDVASTLDALADRLTPPTESEQRKLWFAEGVKAVVSLLNKKADDYANEYGSDDMGGLSFGGGTKGMAMLEYHSGLLELAEEIADLAPPTDTVTMTRDEYAANLEAVAHECVKLLINTGYCSPEMRNKVVAQHMPKEGK
jgi:hypothetical protein